MIITDLLEILSALLPSIKRYYWKSSAKAIPVEGENNEVYLLKKDLYYVQFEYKQIFPSPTGWSNENIMDAAQQITFNELVDQDHQSEPHTQRRGSATFHAVCSEHIQLLLDYPLFVVMEEFRFVIFMSNQNIHESDNQKICLHFVQKLMTTSLQAIFLSKNKSVDTVVASLS